MAAERRRFRARTDVLPRISAYVERRCRRLGGGHEAALRLVLVAEELFVNAMRHGYGGDGRRLVELSVRAVGREIELVLTDRAPPFDPFRDLPRPPASPDPRQHSVGGLGRVLVAEITSRHAYERRGPFNRVTVGVPKRTGAPRRPPGRAKKPRRKAPRSFR